MVGGYHNFGLDERLDFKVVGVNDAMDLQKKVVDQCKQMEPVVIPLFAVLQMNDKTIVSAEIPGIDYSQRPVFYKGSVRIKGSFVRVGESDEVMSEYEIYSYEAYRKKLEPETNIVKNVDYKLLDEQLLNTFLLNVKKYRPNISMLDNNQILELMGIFKDGQITLAGLLLFSIYPQAYFPELCVTCVVVPGDEIGNVGEDGERFIDNKKITGPISTMLEQTCDFILRNSKKKTIIDEHGKRKDKYEYPPIIIRELVLNALMHRDYSEYTINSPISVVMYNNRLEITNSGELYGRVSINELGIKRSETRNLVLATALEILDIAEHRYSGIHTIKLECEKNNLPTAVFISRRGEFKVIIKNDYNDLDLETKVLNYCKIPRTRDEIISFLDKSRYYVMSQIVIPLVESSKLKMTIPNKPKSPKQKYVVND